MKTFIPNHRVVVKKLDTGDVKLDITNDVISIATNKGYCRVSGTWQMILTYQEIDGQRYDELIQTDDMVTIELDAGAGQGFQPIMVGLVDRVSRTFNAGGNNPQRNVKLSGQDLGKLLVKHNIGWDVSGAQVQLMQQQGETAPTKELEANYISRVTLQAGTAENLISQLMDIFIGALDSNAATKFGFASSTDDNWEVWDSSLQYIRGTSAWSAMERYAHKPWNMLHADTVSLGSFQVTLERNPIDDQGRLTRPDSMTHEIGDEDIVQEDVGCSDQERINLLCYWPSMYKISSDTIVEIVMANKDLTSFDEDEIKLHGYCPKVIDDNFNPPNITGPIDQKGYDLLVGAAVTRADAFWNWYSMNHQLESGTFVIHGDPAMKAGDMLLVRQGTTGTKKEYLIEQVAHTYSVWPRVAFTTMLHVTRGQAHA